MTRRRLLWPGAVLLVVAGVGWLPFWSDPVNRVRQGMTLEEVEAVLGANDGGPVPLFAGDEVVLYAWQLGGRWVTVSFATKNGLAKDQLIATGDVGTGYSPLIDRARAFLGL